MKLTRKCHGCKESFRKDEMIEYFSSTGKTSYWFCRDCLAEKQAREKFQNRVCEIFGIKSPGPVIWSQRARLQNKYGYTDDSIVECLDYLFTIKKYSTLNESLGLVAPWSMEETKKWKQAQAGRGSSIAASIASMQTTEYVVPINEKTNLKTEEEFIDD